ncbi:peptide-N(4)-(N-acetyl-beta-glucosaminyl)asparagine amidase [Colias croceus]|uniref:peptide-N(4)-(N-acetyl-beta- glucosaminyl)asparagine amidase n=1 Tax=Colias crocea TaxID=72248 RepID=UPI001E27A2EB|nr:peptide-N(4)-(N-acetyl-beta-glucosaminyl)asparagine amidase [Colias croceus]
MEDMARLAVVEQGVRDIDKFGLILQELLNNINNILENPHDKSARSLKSDFLKNVCDELKDYLNYIGFQWVHNEFLFSKEATLNKLRLAKLAIEKKITFCCGPHKLKLSNTKIKTPKKQYKLMPVYVDIFNKELLLTIQSLFNTILNYENEELQQLAREQIPITTLEIRALERMRENQKKIKTGDTKEHDLPYDRALLMELIGWFKYKYFQWVDAPACEQCDGPTRLLQHTTMRTETETCNVEVYQCKECNCQTRFPRYNDVRALMRSRRGRCGEWANCFTMFCRALGYDTRYVYDTTDHVWCEVFDYESNSWCHVDPCEAVLDTPLMYSHGWGKKLSYVIAVSRDDIQDVTWRYTMNHAEVLSRRKQCTEQELIGCMLLLRDARQAQVSECRRRYLAVRTLRELAQLMVERKPSDYESHGRISGSEEWRTQRGEIGQRSGYIFEFATPGEINIRYYCSPDKYRINCDGTESTVSTWAAGVYQCKNVFRKIEKDWRQVYLAREEGESSGMISWRLSVKGNLAFTKLSIRLTSAVYETGNVDWNLQFDEQQPVNVKLGESTTEFENRFQTLTITAVLSGGIGDVSWQHAQLFRQSLDSKSSALEICTYITNS